MFIRIHPSTHSTGKCSLHGSGLSEIRCVQVSSRTVLRYMHTNIQIKQVADNSITVKGHFMGRHGSRVQHHSSGGAEEDLGCNPQGGFSYSGTEIHCSQIHFDLEESYFRHAEEEGICPTQRAKSWAAENTCVKSPLRHLFLLQPLFSLPPQLSHSFLTL